jgi:hypothetical protein
MSDASDGKEVILASTQVIVQPALKEGIFKKKTCISKKVCYDVRQ